MFHAKGAQINARTRTGWSPLFQACFRGRADNVRLLLSEGPLKKHTRSRMRVGESAFFVCCCGQFARRACVELSLSCPAGAEVNARTVIGWTPLMGASGNGNADVVRTLLRAGMQNKAKQYEALNERNNHLTVLVFNLKSLKVFCTKCRCSDRRKK